jgi:hypothetical protein
MSDHEDGCVGHFPDGDCIDGELLAEERLRARDYDGWAAL